MHDLTKMMVQASMSTKERKLLLTDGIKVLYHMFPLEDTTATERAWVDICLPQSLAMVQQAKSISLPAMVYSELLALCAKSNMSHGCLATGLSQLEEARPVFETKLGPHHPRTLSLMHNMAWAYKNLGRLQDAEHCYRTTLATRGDVLGPHSPDTLETMNDLASVIERAGRLKEAELMFRSLHKLHDSVFGSSDPRTMASAHNLALCQGNQGHLNDAEVMYRIALEQSEKLLGIGDLNTLKTLSNLAATIDHQGRLIEAQVLYERALPLLINAVGYDDFSTLRLRGNMAGVRRQLGHFGVAEDMIRRCHEAMVQLYGPGEFESIQVLYELGEVLYAKGHLQEAASTYKQAISLLSKDMVDHHPVVPRFFDALGIAYTEIGLMKAAQVESERAYAGFMNILGWDDPYTLVAANDYAEWLHATKNYEKAFDLYTRCRDSLVQLVGRNHPHYLTVTNNLGRLAWMMKGPDNPLSFFSEAHAGFEKLVGPDHICTLTVLMNIARTKFINSEPDHVSATFADIQERLTRAVGTAHPSVLACDLLLAFICASEGDVESWQAARTHLQKVVDSRRENSQTRRADHLFAACLLVTVLVQLNEDTSIINAARASIEQMSEVSQELLRLYFPSYGSVSFEKLGTHDLESFDWRSHVRLVAWGATRLRWGRRFCWRKAVKTQLNC